MPILHDVPQYSEAYDRLKLGLPTSSNFSKILTPGGEPSRQWKAYAYHLIAERLLGRKVNTYTSAAMERGVIVEAEAAEWYEFVRDQPTRRIGFVTNNAGTIGCSPDRLIGDEGLLEIKCPMPPAQVEYFLTGKPHRDHRPQLQGQLWITERAWVDILCWNDDLPRPANAIVVRAERDESFIKLLRGAMEQFCERLEAEMNKVYTAGYLHVPEAKAALKDMLRASLEAVPCAR